MRFPASQIVYTTIAAALVAFAVPAHAQQAGLQIAVVDAATDEPIAHAEVIVENSAIGFSRTLRSDANGFVRIEGLTTAGRYSVKANRSPDAPDRVEAEITLRSNFTSSVTLRLAPSSNDAIIVTGAGGIAGLNLVNAEVSASLGQPELAALPIEGRDVLGALVRLPNVVPSTGFFPKHRRYQSTDPMVLIPTICSMASTITRIFWVVSNFPSRWDLLVK